MKFFVPGIKRYETFDYRQSCPSRFAPVSLTGPHCELQCDHCRGSLLRHMHDATREGLLPLATRLARQGAKGLLITGGSDRSGRVPIYEKFDDIGRITRDLRLQVAVHTGFVDMETAAALKKAGVHAAMLDIVGSADTLRSVCHLDAEIGLFEQSLVVLKDSRIRTVPHAVVGLDHGRIRGEREALRIVSRSSADALVLVVLMPLAGTPMERVEAPGIAEIRDLFREARRAMAAKPLYLGCARPSGARGLEISRAAFEAGFDGIAFPSPQIVRTLKKNKICASYVESCCAL